jgi:hypothetical protein
MNMTRALGPVAIGTAAGGGGHSAARGSASAVAGGPVLADDGACRTGRITGNANPGCIRHE